MPLVKTEMMLTSNYYEFVEELIIVVCPMTIDFSTDTSSVDALTRM